MNADAIVNGRTGIIVAALLATVGLGLMSAQTPTMAAAYGGMSEIAKLAAKGGLDAIDAMLDARSPGARVPGALTQTKGRKVSTLKEMFKPKERVLSEGRTRPADDEPVVLDDPGIFTPVDSVPLPSVDLSDADIEPLHPVAGPRPVPGGGTLPIIVPGGGGGGGSSGGGGGGGTTPGGGGAVPEPATWVSLLIGFFAIGFGLRGGAARQPARPLAGRTFP